MYQDLVGLPYVPEVNDCFQILRRYYAKLGVEITDYAFPQDFWSYDDNLYVKYFEREGFEPVDEKEFRFRPRIHDVMLVQGNVRVSFPTHAGILVEPNQVLHHYTGRFSAVEPFSGIWRTPLLALRHKDIKMEEPKKEVLDFTELMPFHVKRKFIQGSEPEV